MRNRMVQVVLAVLLIAMIGLFGCSGPVSSPTAGYRNPELDAEDWNEVETSAEPNAEPVATVASVAPTQDYSILNEEEMTKILTSSIWQSVGIVDGLTGVHILSRQEMAGKRLYMHFYKDFTVHEWDDGGKVNQLAGWVWLNGGHLAIVTKSGAFDREILIDGELLLLKPSETEYIPLGEASDYIAEPKVQ